MGGKRIVFTAAAAVMFTAAVLTYFTLSGGGTVVDNSQPPRETVVAEGLTPAPDGNGGTTAASSGTAAADETALNEAPATETQAATAVAGTMTNADGYVAGLVPGTVKSENAGTGGMAARDAAAKEAAAMKVAQTDNAKAAVKTLLDFYSYLSSEENYQKAVDLLDDGFSLRLELLKQYGVIEIDKSDITEGSVGIYADMLKAASLDSVLKAETDGGICTVYYYQTMILNEDSQVRQPLLAQLRKVKDAYEISSITDADGEKPPFTLQAAS